MESEIDNILDTNTFYIRRLSKMLFDDSSKSAIEKFNSQEKLKQLFEQSFYHNFIEKTQMKILFYKLNEIKLKKKAEEKDSHRVRISINLERERKKQFDVIKEQASSFVSACSAKAITDYQNFLQDAEGKAVKIQNYFRKSLSRLINKMEYMNYKLLVEEEQAMQRKKKKKNSKK
jgi:hypothetical protein